MKTRLFIIITTSLIAANASAVNLIDVYKQALTSDPKFKAAKSQWLADKETLAIKRSALFPQLSISSSLSRNHANIHASSRATTAYNSLANYSLSLTQPLFNFGDWATVWQAQATAKKAEVTFFAAAEDLLLRTAAAYFAALKAKDILSFSRANKEFLSNTLNQAQHKYDVGLIPITDLENARADYDSAVAKEIATVNELSDTFEKLNEITAIRYLSLAPIREHFPLLSPQPTDIEKWAQAAEQQNFDLAAARYSTIWARENIKIQKAGHLPTLNANGNYTYNYKTNYNSSGSEHDQQTTAGLSLNLPVFQGGQVLASARQANYQYQKALSDQELMHRLVVSQTRQAYLNVLSEISQIKANKQAIASALSSLRATKTGYEVGTRTMTDVLQAQANLYNKQKDFANSEYDYIIQLLKLKQLTGILEANDLAQINSWLSQTVPIKSGKTGIRVVAKNKTKTSHKKQSPKTKVIGPIITMPMVEAPNPNPETAMNINSAANTTAGVANDKPEEVQAKQETTPNISNTTSTITEAADNTVAIAQPNPLNNK